MTRGAVVAMAGAVGPGWRGRCAAAVAPRPYEERAAEPGLAELLRRGPSCRAARRWPTRRRARGTRSVTTGACSLPWRGSPGRAGRAGKEELSETSRMKGSELREKRRAFTGC